MIVPKEIALKYKFELQYFKQLKRILDDTLIAYVSKHLYAYSSRIKSIDSLSEKIESGRYSNWYDLDDIVASVIIIPNLNYEEDVLNYLNSVFAPTIVRKRGDSFKCYEVFRFDSTRFIGKLRSSGQDSEIFKINFEVQIRSAFEHAWSVATHDLAYKNQEIDWKTLRLASQLKSSVEQLDMITLGAREIKNHIKENKWPPTETKKKICDYFHKKFELKQIPEELKPKDLSRLCDNVFTLIENNIRMDNSRKRNNDLIVIFKSIDEFLELFRNTSFPMSMSLFQIIFGILLSRRLIAEHTFNKRPFLLGEIFSIVFPDTKGLSISEFII